MNVFRDATGREWRIEIDLLTASRIRSLLRVNLFDAFDDGWKLWREITTDPEILLNVLYRLCQAQADARNLDCEAFARALAGDAIQGACRAFTEELLDFFPDARKRALHRETYRLATQINSDVLETMERQRTGRSWRISSWARSVFRRRGRRSAQSTG